MNPSLTPAARLSRRMLGFGLAWLVAAFVSTPSSAQCTGGPGRTCVNVRSGAGQGITAIVGAPGLPLRVGAFVPADFAAAAAGVSLVQVTPVPGAWIPAITDTAAKWIGITSHGQSGGFLLSHPFILDGCAFDNACIEFSFAADDQLGDPVSNGPNNIGVFLNGTPVPGFVTGGFSSETTFSSAGIGSLLRSGCNRLEVYVRDLGYSISGVVYSARICFDNECLAQEHIFLKSGNGGGAVDSQVRVLGVTPGIAITPAQFAAGCSSSTFASIMPTPPGWCSIAGNNAPQWITNPGYGTLYSQPFEITACNITSMRIQARGAVYRFLGDTDGSPNVGVYINGKPILGSIADGLGGTACLSGEATVGGCDLVTGTNCLSIYVRDVLSPIAPLTALLYDFHLTVKSCAAPEHIGFVSDSTVMQRAGFPSMPLQWLPFAWPLDFTCSTPAVVVAPHPAWCPSIGGSTAAWLSVDANRGPASILFCQNFQVATCQGSIGSAILTLKYAVDDHLGDKASFGPNSAGVYINGRPVPASWTINGGPGICRVMTRDISKLLVTGANTFSLYCRDTAGVVSGAMWDAAIDISPCPRSLVVIGSGCVDVNTTLDVASALQIGTTGVIDVHPAAVSSIGVFLGLGFGAVPPIDLAMLGAPGCTLDIALLDAMFQPAFGPVASFPLAIPNDPAYVGVELFMQGLVLDPAANALGLVTSPAYSLAIE